MPKERKIYAVTYYIKWIRTILGQTVCDMYVTLPVVDLASRRACHLTDWTVGSAPDQSAKINHKLKNSLKSYVNRLDITLTLQNGRGRS